MQRAIWTRRSFFLLPLAVTLACQGAPGDGEVPSEPSEPEEAGVVGASAQTSPTRAVLPGLFTLMAGLEADMAGLDRGLWREDLDTIAAYADAVAGHPTIPPDEVAAIAGVLGEEMATFKGFDTEVHDLAVRTRDAAAAGDLQDVLTAQAELHQGCVACHTRFRERIRDGV